ncbi:MAG: two-component system response regulator OmpR [Azoarcus sp.]|jgi:two-component system phosphate regulon response regulator OmpR|nr:two-component system response regulator OmpR [Azoarcus sp.]
MAQKKSRYRILIADSDPHLCEPLSRYFQRNGFSTKAVSDEEAMDSVMARFCFDLIVLDLMLSGEGGLSVCHRLRKAKNTTPIIMLAASGNDEDYIVGLEAGADDCMRKPFNPRELLARVQAIIRRQPVIPPGTPDARHNVVTFGNTRIRLDTRTVFRNGNEILITTGEFSLLKILVKNPRQPLSRDKLTELSRGREYEASSRLIDVQLSRLRRLVEDNPSKPRYLQTVWGFGYVFVPDSGSFDSAEN